MSTRRLRSGQLPTENHQQWQIHVNSCLAFNYVVDSCLVGKCLAGSCLGGSGLIVSVGSGLTACHMAANSPDGNKMTVSVGTGLTACHMAANSPVGSGLTVCLLAPVWPPVIWLLTVRLAVVSGQVGGARVVLPPWPAGTARPSRHLLYHQGATNARPTSQLSPLHVAVLRAFIPRSHRVGSSYNGSEAGGGGSCDPGQTLVQNTSISVLIYHIQETSFGKHSQLTVWS